MDGNRFDNLAKSFATQRSRREVVAQMLDYGANATEYRPVDRMREAFARRREAAGTEPDPELSLFLGEEGKE